MSGYNNVGISNPEVRIKDKNNDIAEIDSSWNALTMMSLSHHAVHIGKSFCCTNYQEDIDKNQEVIYSYINNDSNYDHLVFQISSTSKVLFQFYKDSTFLNSGSYLESFNMNFGNLNTSSVKIELNPIINDRGQLILASIVGGNNSSGDLTLQEIRSDIEYIIPPHSSCLLSIKSFAKNTSTSLNLMWYEISMNN